MRTLQLPLGVEFCERNPYFIFGRHQAEAEIRAAIIEAYGFVHDRYRNVQMDGMVRWVEITENIFKATEQFGTKTVNRGGQRRLLWQGMDGEAAEIIVLRGRPCGECFDTSVRGPSSEQHALLADGSFRSEYGTPMTIGSYIFHDLAPEEGYCEAWFVAQGETRKGWDRVRCEECVYLGKMRFIGNESGELQVIDIQP